MKTHKNLASVIRSVVTETHNKGDIKEESEWMRTMHFTPEDHEREAAKHLKDADAHKKSGNMPEHYAAMINHYTSKARALERKTPLRGTGPQ